MSEKKLVIYSSRKAGRWSWLWVADGCSASTEPVESPFERNVHEFRKGLLGMSILELNKTLSSNRACKKWLRQNTLYNPARQNYEAYHHGLRLPWRVERYYSRYNSYRPVRGRIVLRKPRSWTKPIVWDARDYRFLKKMM